MTQESFFFDAKSGNSVKIYMRFSQLALYFYNQVAKINKLGTKIKLRPLFKQVSVKEVRKSSDFFFFDTTKTHELICRLFVKLK